MTHVRAPQPFILAEDDVLDYESGRAAGKELNRRRVDARLELEKAGKKRIELETVYRKARALKRLEVTATDGPGRKEQVDAWTTDEWQAKEDQQVIVDMWKERLEEIDGQRATLHRLLEWSMRLDPLAAQHFAQSRQTA